MVLILNFVAVEDSSPLITYLPAGAWSDSPGSDSLLQVRLFLVGWRLGSSLTHNAVVLGRFFAYDVSPGGDRFFHFQWSAVYILRTVGTSHSDVMTAGTGVWLFGGHRSNYGTYEVVIDGQTTSRANGNSATSEVNQLLGGASGLPMGEHTVVLTNTASNPAQDVMDLDSVTFETQVGTAGYVDLISPAVVSLRHLIPTPARLCLLTRWTTRIPV